jgi:hypothetical protein
MVSRLMDTSNKPSRPVRKLAATVETVDVETGKVVKTAPVAWGVMPPKKGLCQICAVDHLPEDPHNAQSLYYQMCFQNQVGRAATWADATAHCTEKMQASWKYLLRKNWTEPPNGEKPVKHHGVE